MNFKAFSNAVEQRFAKLARGQLFVADVGNDVLWETYLGAFPDGTDGVYRTNRAHDCSCCRGFIKAVGNLVGIVEGKTVSIWGGLGDVYEPYATVAAAMDELVRAAPIRTAFFTKFPSAGTVRNFDKEGNLWEHFHCDIPHFNVKSAQGAAGKARARAEGIFQGIYRSLEEISAGAIREVQDLIARGSLYRGQEAAKRLSDLLKMQEVFNKTEDKETFAWSLLEFPWLAIRNTAMGKLLVDLSEGVELEKAVLKYEAIMAPANYRRPIALVTKSMISEALKTIEGLGMTSALERRHVTASDIGVNNLIWTNRSAGAPDKGGLEALLMGAALPSGRVGVGREVTIAHFIREVLPHTSKLEILVDGQHIGNLVSLIGPVHQDARLLFSWPNPFSWTYRGNLTDSVKESVKAAGGNVTGVGRVSLSWFNTDDLDLHVYTPDGSHIYYAARSGQGGVLDVDMNAAPPIVRDAVENVAWANRMPDGVYRVEVRNYKMREAVDVGFDISAEIYGKTHRLHYEGAVRKPVSVCEFTVSSEQLTEFTPHLPERLDRRVSFEWGLKVGEFYEVSMVSLSPNFWEGGSTGNKHWIFVIPSCINEEPCRGIYNEFLSSELQGHRKVFELIGAKTMCAPSQEQMSGLGFSSTVRDSFTVKADSKTYTVTI